MASTEGRPEGATMDVARRRECVVPVSGRCRALGSAVRPLGVRGGTDALTKVTHVAATVSAIGGTDVGKKLALVERL